MTIQRQIIAFGGGGLDKNPLNDLYLLAQSPISSPRVCLIPTASGDSWSVIRDFFAVFNRYQCETTLLPLFQPTVSDITDYLCQQDIIFVPGGNTKCMLDIWKGYGVDKALKAAYEDGVILAGGSAGAVCWFQECLTDSFPGRLSPMPALGFLPYSCCPHYSLKVRRQLYRQMVTSKELSDGYAIADHSGLHFIDEQLYRAVADIPNSAAHWVALQEGKLLHDKLEVKCLADRRIQQELLYSPKEEHEDPEEAQLEEEEPQPILDPTVVVEMPRSIDLVVHTETAS